MATETSGMHRFSNVTARVPQGGIGLQVVPGATIYVTLTSTGAEATIYSDPGMTIQIPGALITADQDGFYEYYIPLAYNVTEAISTPSGIVTIISNIVQN